MGSTMGFTKEQCFHYGKFLAREGAKYPWNYVWVDGNGSYAAVWIMIPSTIDVDDSDLSEVEKRHWTCTFHKLERWAMENNFGNQWLIGTATMVRASAQGSGLFGKLYQQSSATARDSGYNALLTYTANSRAIKGLTKAPLVGKVFDQLIAMPAPLANALTIAVRPVLSAAKLLPKNTYGRYEPLDSIPGVSGMPSMLMVVSDFPSKPTRSEQCCFMFGWIFVLLQIIILFMLLPIVNSLQI